MPGGRFHSFVVFAEMRTGSNFLETNLNAFDGIACHGEAFNPHFIGYPNSESILEITQTERDENPVKLLTAIRDDSGVIGGFRYFHDHDPRIFDTLIDDPACAKIILTRNPLDSYVSWKIAQATGQWKLTDAKARKGGKAVFDADEFMAHLAALQAFQVDLLNRLQISGQTAFYVAYDDLQSVEVMNGIARFLGVDETLESLDKTLKKQNPSPVSEKVENYGEMLAALGKLDHFDLTRTPNFEPRRGPSVPGYVAAAKAPLVYLPIGGGPEAQIRRWLAALDDVGPAALWTKMSQKDLRQWKRSHKGHRTFTVLRHPVLRAHEVYCYRILNTGKGSFLQLRQTLVRRYNLPLPEHDDDPTYDLSAHKAAFSAFLAFLKANLAGQTAVRVDPAWCTQAQTIQGFGEFMLPDLILRESELETELNRLAQQAGYAPTPLPAVASFARYKLSDIYDAEIETLVQDAYQRDYMMFGFDAWR